MSPSPRSFARWSSKNQLKIQRPWWLLFISITFLLSFLALDLASSVLRHANNLGRNCYSPLVVYTSVVPVENRPRMAIVSLSNQVQDAVWKNKKAYTKKMGYHFIDSSWMIDRSRPPSWSKILAIKSALRDHDWVFWNDADTLVTNPEIYLENILVALIGHSDFNSTPDLILTADYNGVNAGVFFVRKSEWSERFLDTWWNQTSFVQFGSTKSGDNAALMYLIDNLPKEESQVHVRISPMQCLFNSYPWFPSKKSVYRLLLSPWTTWQGAYSDGDFMVHLAGLQNKKKWVSRIIEDMRIPRRKMFFNPN
ncbi:putative alpha-1,6-mannosyltransferase MNN10 [Carex rostrata]